jgi:hypothetical protein
MIIKIEINTGDKWSNSDSVVRMINKAGEVVEKVIDKAIKDEGAQNEDVKR